MIAAWFTPDFDTTRGRRASRAWGAGQTAYFPHATRALLFGFHARLRRSPDPPPQSGSPSSPGSPSALMMASRACDGVEPGGLTARRREPGVSRASFGRASGIAKRVTCAPAQTQVTDPACTLDLYISDRSMPELHTYVPLIQGCLVTPMQRGPQQGRQTPSGVTHKRSQKTRSTTRQPVILGSPVTSTQ